MAKIAVLLPNGKQQFFDGNGSPLAGGSVYFYIPNTTTFKNTWQDAGETTLNTNPVLLDSAGTAIIYGEGQYRQLVKDALGNTIWDQLTSSPPTNGPQQTLSSASTTDLGSASSNVIQITGTTTINSFGSSADVNTPIYFLTFSGALTLTYNATAMILPGAANIITAAGDTAIAQYLGSGNWRVIEYTKANGQAVISPAPQVSSFTSGTAQTYTVPTVNGIRALWVEIAVVGGGGGGGGGQATKGSGSGGGAGGYVWTIVSAPPATMTYSVGAGGAGGAAGNHNGTTGGDSTVTSGAVVLTGMGGGAGASTSSVNAPNGGAGGSVSGGLVFSSGGDGAPGQNSTGTPPSGGMGGASFYGGGSRGGPAGNGASDAQPSGAGGGGGGPSASADAVGGAGQAGRVTFIAHWQ